MFHLAGATLTIAVDDCSALIRVPECWIRCRAASELSVASVLRNVRVRVLLHRSPV